jgi:hypothetical protein
MTVKGANMTKRESDLRLFNRAFGILDDKGFAVGILNICCRTCAFADLTGGDDIPVAFVVDGDNYGRVFGSHREVKKWPVYIYWGSIMADAVTIVEALNEVGLVAELPPHEGKAVVVTGRTVDTD